MKYKNYSYANKNRLFRFRLKHKHMYNITFRLFIFFVFICTINTHSQEMNAKIIDSITKEPVPYATVIFNKKGMISNEDGRFSFLFSNDTNPTDSLVISCIGFETFSKPLNKFKDSVIYLIPKITELKEIVLSNNKFTADEIIEKVKSNIDKNYNFDLTKKRLFFREANHQNLLRTDFTLKKSTIDALNKQFLDSAMQSIPRKNAYYTEVLCDLYGNFSKDMQKIKLIKASELYDKNNRVGLNALEEQFKKIIDKNVKPDSYFKIKSGFFGQKLDMDEIKGEESDSSDNEELKKKLESEKKREANRKANFANYRKNSLANLMDGLFFQENSKLNFISKSWKYDFKMLDLTYLGDEAVYVLEFLPKGSADYKGTLYINYDDYAIIRVDYENVKSIKRFKLLGISFDKYLSKGKMIFVKEKSGRYSLQYLEKEDASKFGVKRPLKIIEKNKHVRGRRKQNELSLKLNMAIASSNKNQVVIFDTENLSNAIFESFKEDNTTLPTYMPAYNPEFWKGYNIMEPNQAIKNFTVITE